MFSWSTNRRRPSGYASGGVAEEYPGDRHDGLDVVAGNTNYNPVGRATTTPSSMTAVQGSIRPPPPSLSTTGNANSNNSDAGGGILYTRQQHLDSYLQDATLARSTRRISTDDSTYDTVFQTVDGYTLILRVHIPLAAASVPMVQPPIMTLAGVGATHPWLDDVLMRVIGYPPIQSSTAWQASRLLLGIAVRQVVEHFQLQPPTVSRFTDRALERMNQKTSQVPSRTSNNASTNGTSGNSKTAAAAAKPKHNEPPPPSFDDLRMSISSTATVVPGPTVDMPPVPGKFEAIEALTREQLDELLDDPLEMVAFCHRLPYMQRLRMMQQKSMDESVQMAKDNMKLQEKLHQMQQSCRQLQLSLESKVQEFVPLKKRQDAICAPPDVKAVVRALTRAKKDALDASEQCADEWVEGTSSSPTAADDFVKTFLQKRQLHHIRAAKLELLKMQQQQQQGNVTMLSSSSSPQPPPQQQHRF